jgi:hypothetical protein
MDWRELTRGIEPWDGAKLLNGLRCLWYRNGADGPCGVTVRHEDGRMQCGVWPLTQGGYNPDLADPDTRAAFDRRLALRLGAPPEAVDEGVLFYRVGRQFRIAAGSADENGLHVWCHGVPGSANDSLLARALAWRSVSPEAP